MTDTDTVLIYWVSALMTIQVLVQHYMLACNSSTMHKQESIGDIYVHIHESLTHPFMPTHPFMYMYAHTHARARNHTHPPTPTHTHAHAFLQCVGKYTHPHTRGELICLRLLGWEPGVPSSGRGEEGREDARNEREEARGILIGAWPSVPQFLCTHTDSEFVIRQFMVTM